MQLIARLRAKGIRISVVDGGLEVDAPKGELDAELRAAIVANKSDLLRLLSWSRRSVQATAMPLQPADRSKPLPLSWAQQRLWFLDQLEPGNAAYNISWTVRLRGALDTAALEAALLRVVQRHEALRTVFPAIDGEPEQRVLDNVELRVQRMDMRGVAEEQLRARLAELAGYSFDLAAELLIRPVLLQLADEEHILLVVVHHIVADGASMRILFRELAACYDAGPDAEPEGLTPLTVQYADYSVWQRSWLNSDEIDRQSAYWRDKLAGLPPLLELPTDRPRSAAMRYRGASVLKVLPPELAAALRRLSRDNGCTLFMTMLAAFFVLLMRYSGRDDLVVGTPLGGRSRTSLEGLIGFFINTVVLRADLGGDPCFSELLQRVREVALEAHANQDLPFEKLVEVLQPQRELSYSPVFQVMFDLQEEPRWKLPVRSLEVIPEVVFSSRTASFDLTLSVRQAEQGLDAMFEYDTDLFDETSIEAMAGHYQTLLEAVVSDADQPVAQLPLIDPATQRLQVHSWNSVKLAYPDDMTLAELFSEQAAKHPDYEAVRDGARNYSYSQLNAVANGIAWRLLDAGVQAEMPVAVCARHSAEAVIAVLAIHKAGGYVVPLDPAYPAERLRFMLEDSGATLLLYQSADTALAESLLDAGHCRGMALSTVACAPGGGRQQNPPPQAGARNLAYLMYTSGTTGVPKGVELEHRGFSNYLCWLAQQTGLAPADNVLQFASLSFDIAIEESLAALLNGATLVLREPRMSQSVEDFVAGCEQHAISWLSLPTAWWHELCEALRRGDVTLPDSLRAVVIGGEKAELGALSKWHDHAADIRLFNTYGPTEASIAVAWSELTHLDPRALTDVPLGYPVPNARVWVMDELQRPVPPGLPGEICIGGPGLARGYRNQSGLTRERFVTVQLPDGSSERLYRTGDRARYVADHGLLYLGRADGQIKLRGHRIEPAEIEAVLGAMPGAGRCAVVPHGEGASLRLIAYVSGSATTAELHAALRECLPDYMVPAAVVSVPRLPFTANGKLDRDALPAPELAQVGSVHYAPPVTEVQRQLATIWADVLGIAEPGIHDDFFLLGGHSLIATRVVARVRDAFGAAVPLRALFDQPTIAELADVVEGYSVEDEGPRLRANAATTELAPLAWAQQRLWMLDALEPGNTAYNLYSAYELRGELQLQALRLAVNTITARHASLRTVFTEQHGNAVQVVRENAPVDVSLHSMPAATDAEIRAQLQELIDEPFRLGSGPLWRVHVLQTDAGGQRHVLLLLLHHIVADGWSMKVLFDELRVFYAAVCNDDSTVAATLPPLPLQYADYAVWQREQLQSGALQSDEDYWLEQLADAPPLLPLPLDFERPTVQTYAGRWASCALDSELLTRLREVAARESCSLFMVLLAAFKALLLRHTGVTDLLVGTPVAGRTRTELEPLIGCFLNTLVLRTRTGDDPTLRDMLAAVRQTTLEAYEHQALPFERLLDRLQPPRTPAYTPLIQVMFNLHNERGENLNLPDLESRPLLLDRAAAKFDLSVSIAEGDAGLQVGFEYNSGLFAPATMTTMLEHYVVLLRALAGDSARKVTAVPLSAARVAAPEFAAEQLASAYARSFDPTDYPGLDARFRAVVARHPQRPAVSVAGSLYSYAQLDGWCNAVAAALSAALPDADGEQRVGLMPGHDAGLAAAVFGTLRAGAAYVPLDAALPEARLREIVAAARIRCLLVDPAYRRQVANLEQSGVAVVVMPRPDAATPCRIAPRAAADLAYVLFTSGTTGQPKGVMQTQANVLHHAAIYSASVAVCPDDRLTQFAHFGFDAAVMDIFGALLNGACLMPLDITSLDAAQLAEALADVTILHTTPTVFRYCLQQLADDASLAKVRAVILGGEKAQHTDFTLFRRRFARDAIFINGLGPSESTTALQFRAGHATRLPGRQVPVGTAVPGTEVLLLDEQAEPAGLRGEIVIRSPHVSPGYLQQEELTAAKMRDGMYFTGDRGRRLPDGQIVYEGRLDAQLQINGRRTEPAEIEYALSGLSGVDACAVVVADGALVACYTGSAAAAELQRGLRSLLPRWMVPGRFESVSALPRLANGKVDRVALQESLPAPRAIDGRPPEGPVEKRIATLFGDLLNADFVGADSDFFGLGGHSLLAMQLLARLREEFPTRLRLADVFAQPTPAELAAAVVAASADGERTTKLQPRPADVALPPLSWAQQRLWFLDRLDPGNAAYNLHWAARIDGTPDLTVLTQALDDVLQRHESLRTAFVDHAGSPVQLIREHVTLQPIVERMHGASESGIQRRLLELTRQPFDLQESPLFRVWLIEVADNRSVLLLVLHHIVADGWSMGVLFDDLSRCYAARANGHAPVLESLPVQYADFVVWQQDWLVGKELERQQQYWAGKLAGMPPLLELPFDKPRPPVQRFRGAWVNTTFSRELLAAVRELAESESATVFMVVLAAFKVLLMRHTGRTDVVVGAPIAGRSRSETERLVGFFLNTLVLRTSIDSDASFRAVLAEVRRTTLGAYDHQELPFEKLLEILQPARSTAHAPLVQVTINLHNEPGGSLSLDGLQADVLTIDRGTAKFDLALSLVETRAGLRAGFEYNTDLFRASTVQRLLQHLSELLEAFVADPATPVCRPVLGSDDRRVTIKHDYEPLPPDMEQGTIWQRFASVAAKHAQRLAVVTDDKRVSYAELATRAAAIAAAVQQSVGRPGGGDGQARVALVLDHDVDALAALLGVLQAGHIYVPLDPRAPAARQQRILEISEPALVVTSGRHADELPALPNGTGLLLTEDIAESADCPDAVVTAGPDDLAYLLFTSGTTGEPKAVIQTHGNVLRHIRAYSDALHIGCDDRLTLLAALGFDAAVMDVYAALLNGAVLCPLELRAEEYPGQTLDRIAAAGATVLHATPTVYRFLMRSKVCRHELDTVRAVVLGGEEAHASDFELFRRQFAPPAVFINGLGPSEATVAAQYFADHETVLPGGLVPVGAAVAGTELRIVDAAGEPTSLQGELAIVSTAVATGYWRDPELTAARFQVLPDGRTLYRTGDRVRRLPDGQLVFAGRMDAQIKLRGVRIEPAEIETAMAAHELVRDAAVVLHEDSYTGDARLVAWYTGDADSQELRRYLRGQLPDYMVPSVCMHVAELPLTASGKLDRRRLPEPGRETSAASGYVAPQSETEQQLERIWADVLGISRVGVHDDFFDLGGHSLMAAQLAARVNESMQVTLPLRRVFDEPTISALAAHIDNMRWVSRPGD